MGHATEPGHSAANGQHRNNVAEAYSAQPGDVQNSNRVAQAEAAAAHHVEANQRVSSSKSKSRVDDPHVAKLVQEENESRNKFPKYPGLERWELLEKMGDGAFSNVYRAKDLSGNAGEVAIKVVRKYEMNNIQVSSRLLVVSMSPTSLFCSCLFSGRHLYFCFQQIKRFLYQPLGSDFRATNIYIRISRRFRRQQRCGDIPFFCQILTIVSSLLGYLLIRLHTRWGLVF